MTAVALSVAVALASACGSTDARSDSTARVPPDRLEATLSGGGGPDFRLALDCAVADRAACAEVLSAIADAEGEEACAPAPAGDDGAILVSGTIGGERVESVVTRRTDCEIRTYDRVVAGLGL